MAIKYLSVCSGIEAATVAWHPLGWEAVAYSEIEPFPCKVLAHHYPNTPNWGDMTKFKEWPDATIDLLVGGTPCQSFSVAGLRQGLEDPRGELMLTYLAIAARYRPRWVVWENVPGVLSSNGGRDFGAFLGALGQLGYGWAYRVLDAQWFGVAQRRKRVFVVGCFGDWERAAKVLFESESVRRDTPSRRGKEKDVAGTIKASSFCGGASGKPEGAAGNHFVPAVAGSLDTECGGGKLTHQSAANGHIVALQDVRAVNKAQNGRGWNDDGSAYTVDTHATQGVCVPSFWNGEQVTQTLDAVLAEGQTMPEKNRFPAVLVPVAFKPGQSEAAGGLFVTEGYAPTLQAQNNGSTAVPAVAYAAQSVATAMQVRRLTVTECERLQGFPDNYTNIPGAKDAPRYKALGNSMAVPCMAWIGERICS